MHVKRVLTRLIRGILHYCWDGFHQQCVMNPVVHTPVNSPHKPTSLAQQVSQLVGAIIDSRLKRTPTNWWPTGTPSPRWTLLLTLGLVASREALSTYGGPVCHTTKSQHLSDLRPTLDSLRFQSYLCLRCFLGSICHILLPTCLSAHLLFFQAQKSDPTCCANLQQKILLQIKVTCPDLQRKYNFFFQDVERKALVLSRNPIPYGK